ncbi:MAG: hypothetical protein QNJ23_01855 [Woeseiaceae bacterium]|nr:hypothetical protein [Woeseiaceae bacterium]
MTRSPYWHAMRRGVEAEGGGVADLQTDVMRFMAILAICLVVIFALVQSIPLRPSQPVTEAVPEPVAEVVPEPVAEPEPAPAPVPESPPAPAPEPVAVEPPVMEPVPEPTPEREGFTLRFESDLALKRLVARSVVGLYAFGEDSAVRLNVSGGRMSFWEASTPNQYHEMDSATVPADVVRALLRTAEVDATAIRWGVTLPGAMQRELNDIIESAGGGALVIGADGNLRLEQ